MHLPLLLEMAASSDPDRVAFTSGPEHLSVDDLHARAANLASRIRCRPILSNPELRKQGGLRPIALEEVLARRDAQLRRRDDLLAAAARRRARACNGGAKQGRRRLRGRPTATSRSTAGPATRRSSTGRS